MELAVLGRPGTTGQTPVLLALGCTRGFIFRAVSSIATSNIDAALRITRKPKIETLSRMQPR
jgi:hypothetical protein